jgi:hypothetical protein
LEISMTEMLVFPLKRQGVQKAMTWAQNWDRVRTHGAPVLTVLAIFGVLFGCIRYVIKSEVADTKTDVGTLKGSVASLQDSVGKTNDRIDTLLAKALERAFPLPDASKDKISGSLDKMNGLLQFAKDQNVRLNPQLLAAYAQQVSEVSSEPRVSGVAWNTLGNLLDYRSSLNATESPAAREDFIPAASNRWELTARAFIKARGAGSITLTYPNRLVPPDQSFIYEPIGSVPTVTKEGHPFVRITAKGKSVLILDGLRLRNAIFEGVRIEYDGGPLIMENTYFVNCTFEVKPPSDPKPAASLQQFTKAVLEKVPASLSVS